MISALAEDFHFMRPATVFLFVCFVLFCFVLFCLLFTENTASISSAQVVGQTCSQSSAHPDK